MTADNRWFQNVNGPTAWNSQLQQRSQQRSDPRQTGLISESPSSSHGMHNEGSQPSHRQVLASHWYSDISPALGLASRPYSHRQTNCRQAKPVSCLRGFFGRSTDSFPCNCNWNKRSSYSSHLALTYLSSQLSQLFFIQLLEHKIHSLVLKELLRWLLAVTVDKFSFLTCNAW